MKKHKKSAVVVLVVLALLATSFTAFAYTVSSPAEILAGLTGKSVEEVTDERYETGLTYGQMAYDQGLWEEYNEKMLEDKKAYLDEKVKDGTITQEQADAIYGNMLLRQEDCTANGFGGGCGGGMMGLGYGSGRGCGGGGRGFGGARNWQ
ncbi:DUF2680 domain-containing protein [Sedimentibacter saalensis]|jgi:hypothetical protein|uniref:Uncharacterized protein DUF2680 n=1 Tax=Sedimentibacter saalensis TaxID=130788 RepID=A0A562JC18_9FIRM|nr:DUF2680 domain-containing protein [Sedimentibacter saalensis]MEA5095237.1 DUF2680 domain-containing protein [Sedimentibacter saalensis]TWH80727.1 uncharacterized protein DUF2680 [Sedimentibacter saalensis]